jgi:LysM repeat protein
MPVTVRSGDTLSGIAARNGVALAALLRANPQIHNPNLIHPGEQISLPGHDGTSSFQPAGGQRYAVRPGDTLSAIGARFGVSYLAIARANGIANPNFIRAGQVLTIPGRSGSPTPAPAPTPTPGPTPSPGSSGGRNALAAAESVLGQNISSLKYNGPLAQFLDKWPGNNVCCANFVSACLQKAGLISHSEHNDNVSGLANNLRRDPHFRSVDANHLSPGDVVCFNVPGEGHMAHVEMFVGYRNGRPLYIGSNNVNPDGSQRISEGSPGYSIDAAFHYVG